MEIQKLKAGTFMGNTQKMRALQGFTLSTTGHDQHMKVPTHEHEHPYISLLLHGVYHEKSTRSEYQVTSGGSLFRPKGFEHKNEIGSHHSYCFNIEIEKMLSDQDLASKTSDYMPFDHHNIEIMKIYYAFQQQFADELLAITVEESLSHLFQSLRSGPKKDRALWVKKIQQEVRLQPEKHYTINGVADALHVHPNYFVRKFKEKTGVTFGEFLLRQRISMGIDLMLHTSKPLTQIAMDCGFYDQSHFIRHFKRFMGTTPFQYRDIVKGSFRTI